MKAQTQEYLQENQNRNINKHLPKIETTIPTQNITITTGTSELEQTIQELNTTKHNIIPINPQKTNTKKILKESNIIITDKHNHQTIPELQNPENQNKTILTNNNPTRTTLTKKIAQITKNNPLAVISKNKKHAKNFSKLSQKTSTYFTYNNYNLKQILNQSKIEEKTALYIETNQETQPEEIKEIKQKNTSLIYLYPDKFWRNQKLQEIKNHTNSFVHTNIKNTLQTPEFKNEKEISKIEQANEAINLEFLTNQHKNKQEQKRKISPYILFHTSRKRSNKYLEKLHLTSQIPGTGIHPHISKEHQPVNTQEGIQQSKQIIDLQQPNLALLEIENEENLPEFTQLFNYTKKHNIKTTIMWNPENIQEKQIINQLKKQTQNTSIGGMIRKPKRIDTSSDIALQSLKTWWQNQQEQDEEKERLTRIQDTKQKIKSIGNLVEGALTAYESTQNLEDQKNWLEKAKNTAKPLLNHLKNKKELIVHEGEGEIGEGGSYGIDIIKKQVRKIQGKNHQENAQIKYDLSQKLQNNPSFEKLLHPINYPEHTLLFSERVKGPQLSYILTKIKNYTTKNNNDQNKEYSRILQNLGKVLTNKHIQKIEEWNQTINQSNLKTILGNQYENPKQVKKRYTKNIQKLPKIIEQNFGIKPPENTQESIKQLIGYLSENKEHYTVYGDFMPTNAIVRGFEGNRRPNTKQIRNKLTGKTSEIAKKGYLKELNDKQIRNKIKRELQEQPLFEIDYGHRTAHILEDYQQISTADSTSFLNQQEYFDGRYGQLIKKINQKRENKIGFDTLERRIMGFYRAARKLSLLFQYSKQTNQEFKNNTITEKEFQGKIKRYKSNFHHYSQISTSILQNILDKQIPQKLTGEKREKMQNHTQKIKNVTQAFQETYQKHIKPHSPREMVNNFKKFYQKKEQRKDQVT